MGGEKGHHRMSVISGGIWDGCGGRARPISGRFLGYSLGRQCSSLSPLVHAYPGGLWPEMELGPRSCWLSLATTLLQESWETEVLSGSEGFGNLGCQAHHKLSKIECTLPQFNVQGKLY